MDHFYAILSSLCYGIVVILIMISLAFLVRNLGKSSYSEDYCYDYYKENNYILERCEVYKDKFLGVKQND